MTLPSSDAVSGSKQCEHAAAITHAARPPARNAFGVFFGRRRSHVEGRSKTDPTLHRFQAQAHSLINTVGSGYSSSM